MSHTPKPLTLAVHGVVRFSGLQAPHYSSGTRTDGRQWQGLNAEALAWLEQLAKASANLDPYGIEERKRRRAGK